MDINAVEQGATDALLIANNGGSRTRTLFDEIRKVATGTPVQLASLQLTQLHVDGHLLVSSIELHRNRVARTKADQGIGQ